MDWKEYSVLTGADCADSIAEIFHRMGSGGVIIEEPQAARGYSTSDGLPADALNLDYADHEFVVIKAYFPEEQDVMQELTRSIEQVEDSYQMKCTVLLNEVKNEDWETTWKEFYHTFRIGHRLVIRPAWESYEPELHEVVVEIDPGMAFGTGVHATTRICLQLTDHFVKGGEEVIDAGCGSGILSIAAVKLGASRVFAMDIDELAVQIARENVSINGLNGQIQVETGNIIEAMQGRQANFILANLTAEIILELIPEACMALKPGGCILGSGIIDSRWPQVKNQLQEFDLDIIEVLQETNWVGFAAKRKTDILA